MGFVEKYWKFMKALATVLVVYQGAYYASTQPGAMDAFNGVMGGLVIYAIWFTSEKRRSKYEEMEQKLKEIQRKL